VPVRTGPAPPFGTRYNSQSTEHSLVIGGAAVFLPLVLMILFRRKYPRWWFDWNLS
jgi:hypothetical protein